MTLLVTGAAGFIGFHVVQALLARGDRVIGVDNLNDYYDPALKRARLAQLDGRDGFTFVQADIADRGQVDALFAKYGFTGIVHLAAQAGVRWSLENPYAYVEANVMGQLVLLEAVRKQVDQAGGQPRFVYASSSSVYGGNEKVPFAIEDPVDHPVSLYAATKRAGELMADTYVSLYGLAATGLRFFTVYGPWGRPDMAYFSFTDAIVAGRPIQVFNDGKMQRDFTWIDDIVAGVVAALDHAKPGHRLYNLGNSTPVELMTFIRVIEDAIGRKAVLDMQPMQPGDVPRTFADIDASTRDLGYAPTTPIEVGIPRFVEWYKSYYRVN
ncbi:SDR family NAD(P)-dependent oxidoreductase [Roseiterribacter gracilis]|uniref:NAD-dependent epimerase n=1 Tax=Roseiterribacter gracilis TaxID=2812848 RepID=A0A8S8XAT5_9PROT|nr:NAD-dependent epimerase [Rhodospirillales bacterium TMPK1]